MVYFSIDVEASGPMAPLYNLLSIGATAVHEEDGGLRIGESFYIELKPIFPGYDAGAMKVCGLDAERLTREGVEPGDAMKRFSSWVRERNRGARERPVFVGHNAVFDWAYIAYYYKHFRLSNPFGYKGIDTKSLAMGRLGLSWTKTSKESLQQILGLPDQDPAQVHRADYDAWYQALILEALLARQPAACLPAS
jgi:DNA polymerase III alpha subunit (gram-positive type)